MNTFLKIFIVFAMFIGLTNCSSLNYFSLSPDEELSSIEMGREVIEKEDEFVLSSLSFEEQANNYFVFYLYVNNKNQKEILIDPKQVYTKVFNENKKSINIKTVKNNAVDPEREIEAVNNEVKERKDSYEIGTALNIGFSLFNTILDLSDDEDNNAEEVVENVLIFAGNQIGQEVSYDNDIEYLKSQKEFWQNASFRKSILSKNEEAEGLIFIPVNKEAKYIKIFIPLGDSMHSYKFRQVEIN